MKKLLTISLIVCFTAVSVQAQTSRDIIQRQGIRELIRDGRLTRNEISIFRLNQFRYERLQHRTRRDDVVTFSEKRKLQRKRMHNRRNMIRYNHIRKDRVI